MDEAHGVEAGAVNPEDGQPDAEDAEISQRTQKNSQDQFSLS
jgi:hypothetical protein